MTQPTARRLGAAIAISAACALGATFACGPAKGRFGETCSVYAQPVDCDKNLQCECVTSGCYCVPFCDSSGGAPCQQGVCASGRDPALNGTGFFCFPPSVLDGGS